MKSGIYEIRSLIKPDRFYIGSTINFKTRRGNHIRQLRRGVHNNPKLQAHFNKYGESDIVFKPILGCKEDLLIDTEQGMMDLWQPWFNICKVAGRTIGVKRRPKTEEERKAISERMKGNQLAKGKRWKLSEETKAKMRKPKSEEHNRKNREAQLRRFGKTKENGSTKGEE